MAFEGGGTWGDPPVPCLWGCPGKSCGQSGMTEDPVCSVRDLDLILPLVGVGTGETWYGEQRPAPPPHPCASGPWPRTPHPAPRCCSGRLPLFGEAPGVGSGRPSLPSYTPSEFSFSDLWNGHDITCVFSQGEREDEEPARRVNMEFLKLRQFYPKGTECCVDLEDALGVCHWLAMG